MQFGSVLRLCGIAFRLCIRFLPLLQSVVRLRRALHGRLRGVVSVFPLDFYARCGEVFAVETYYAHAACVW